MHAFEKMPTLVNDFKFLYGHGLPDWFVHECSRVGFQWQWILVGLRNTNFLYAERGTNITDRVRLPSNEAEEIGEELLQKLAAVAACLPKGTGRAVEYSLQLDGYEVDKRWLRLIPLEGPVSAQAEEDALTSLLHQSDMPNAIIIERHIADANDLFVKGKSHPSLNESRSALQALIDGMSAETHRNGSQSTGLPAGTSNRIDYLAQVGFLTSDEQDAVKSAWHTLCAGSHPGVSERDLARIGLILALEFGQLVLLKWAGWSKNGYGAFPPRAARRKD